MCDTVILKLSALKHDLNSPADGNFAILREAISKCVCAVKLVLSFAKDRPPGSTPREESVALQRNCLLTER